MHSKLRTALAPDSPQTQSRACVTSLCRLQGFALTVNPYRRWIVTSDTTADSLLSFLHLSRVLPNASRPRHAPRVPLLRFGPSLPRTAHSGTSPNQTSEKTECASAVTPENAGFCSEEQKSPLEVPMAFPLSILFRRVKNPVLNGLSSIAPERTRKPHTL